MLSGSNLYRDFEFFLSSALLPRVNYQVFARAHTCATPKCKIRPPSLDWMLGYIRSCAPLKHSYAPRRNPHLVHIPAWNTYHILTGIVFLVHASARPLQNSLTSNIFLVIPSELNSPSLSVSTDINIKCSFMESNFMTVPQVFSIYVHGEHGWSAKAGCWVGEELLALGRFRMGSHSS
jgi:hypothetical protein